MALYQIEVDEIGHEGKLSCSLSIRHIQSLNFDPIPIRYCPWCGEVFEDEYLCDLCGGRMERIDSHIQACPICRADRF